MKLIIFILIVLIIAALLIRIILRSVNRKRKLTAVCSHQTRIGNLDAHLI
ncbi:hypothetical protein JMT78AECX_JMT78AEC_05658 [Escherichia coli]|nr:hypothetical protein JRT64AECX_JRT64AEC_05419 [Escherichia coli]CAJ1310404.1 hypothetical protein JRT13AECX_JRT13AEC_05399 [Escherichia coli]CAJ1310713.1 hypothetical protein JMT78AECX_JMT78AEC_05658 [Escherichia coli]